jgi:hypothetical protein
MRNGLDGVVFNWFFLLCMIWFDFGVVLRLLAASRPTAESLAASNRHLGVEQKLYAR